LLAQERLLRTEGRSETRLRLLAAASEEFAQRGYANARVRQIVDQAKVNLAAVNYHFGGKEGLYRATLAHLAERQGQHPALTQRRGRTPRARFERHVFALLERYLHPHGAVLGRILAHEAMNPTSHLEDLLAESLGPELAYLQELLSAAAPTAPAGDVELAAIGVLGQCVLYQFAQPALCRTRPGLPHGKALCRAVSRHVAGMTLAGLAALEKTPIE
jgi:AcrR family transcriptional regulator